MATHKMIIAGFGGQGVMLMGTMLAYAAMEEEKEVTWMPSYGPEMRGGTANCTVIVSDRPIASPLATEIDSLVAMNGPSLERFIDNVKPGGKLFLNSSLITQEVERKDISVFSIDATGIAETLENTKVSNMVMLGAIVRKSGIVSIASLEKVVEKQFATGSKARLLPLNLKALSAWEEA
ncbi:MAG: 2-oxoacid:acceptor oxidoreductase family protein [Bacillota bacterium]|nr:2-oxoacid:acceptor oxidoreductase family protein [Bacillota bacterium]